MDVKEGYRPWLVTVKANGAGWPTGGGPAVPVAPLRAA